MFISFPFTISFDFIGIRNKIFKSFEKYSAFKLSNILFPNSIMKFINSNMFINVYSWFILPSSFVTYIDVTIIVIANDRNTIRNAIADSIFSFRVSCFSWRFEFFIIMLVIFLIFLILRELIFV